MRTTWRVTKIIETEGKRVAELVRVEWFKRNPAFDEMMEAWRKVEESEGAEAADEQFADIDPPEFLDDVGPGDPDANFIDADGSLTLDIADGLDLHAGDNVILTLDALARVPS